MNIMNMMMNMMNMIMNMMNKMMNMRYMMMNMIMNMMNMIRRRGEKEEEEVEACCIQYKDYVLSYSLLLKFYVMEKEDIYFYIVIL